jgi:hypothetical protein
VPSIGSTIQRRPRRPAQLALFLAEDAVVRKTFGNLPAQVSFSFTVGDRNVAAVGFRTRLGLAGESI